MTPNSAFGGAVDLQAHMKARVEEQQRQARLDAEGRTDHVSPTEIYDSEVIKIESVLQALRRYANDHGTQDVDAFDRQITNRFNDIGFRVSTNWHNTNAEKVYMPEITITGRTDAVSFDREQQRHEIVNDLLERGEGGTIKMTKADMEAIDAAGHHKH